MNLEQTILCVLGNIEKKILECTSGYIEVFGCVKVTDNIRTINIVTFITIMTMLNFSIQKVQHLSLDMNSYEFNICEITV